MITCESIGKRYQVCSVPYGRIYSIDLVYQRSEATCREGYSYGVRDSYSIWVDRGCRGDFRIFTR